MDEYEFVRARQQRLALYRRTLEFLAAQQGQGGAFPHADLERQLDDVRREIQAINRELSAHGVVVEDHSNDAGQDLVLPPSEAPTTNQDVLPLLYQQLFVDRLRS